jgi:lysophospholipase L1-like esterase
MKKLLVFAVTVMFALPMAAQGEYHLRSESLYELLPVKHHNIVFLGSSIADECEWAELFDNRNILNRGIGGDRAVWLSRRLDPIVKGRPRKLVIYIGGNDLGAGISIDETVKAIEGVFERFQKDSPRTKIYINSVFPVNLTYRSYANAQNRNEMIVELNRRIKELAESRGVTYIDVHSALKDDKGNLRAELTNDGLHLMGEGYMVWKKVLEPYMK